MGDDAPDRGAFDGLTPSDDCTLGPSGDDPALAGAVRDEIDRAIRELPRN